MRQMPFEEVPRGLASNEVAPRGASLASMGEVLTCGTARNDGRQRPSSARRPEDIFPRGKGLVSLGTTNGPAYPSREARGQNVALTSATSRVDQDPTVKCVR